MHKRKLRILLKKYVTPLSSSDVSLISKISKLILSGIDVVTMGNHTWGKKDIFNIIESDKATFTSIIDMIEARGKQVIYKNAPIYNFETEFEMDNFNVITRKTISVFGTTGSRKSYVSSLIAHLVSKKMKLNTLLMDMDVQNSSLDLYNNIIQ